ncbi:MAG: class I adenylate cyclase, partial [Desulfobacterales bacterium]|nr:class I adenylate cyclase [Desulfobacterales bacterium]
YTMGSVGSLAQTHESDIDYWICINENNYTEEESKLLKQKLEAIERFAEKQFKLSITFFVVDVLKARNNDFGDTSQESSGSAQARLLKEEFYRTMIHVAGKLPLWAVIPTPVSLNHYNTIRDQVEQVVRSQRYVDLGDIHAIPVNEYFGASIWQMFKWLKSPFKSVIKMGLLEKYIHDYGKEALLCNQYKNKWMNSGSYMKQAEKDSYILLLNNLLDYYRSVRDEKASSLLLSCFFLKLGIAKESFAEQTTFGLRKVLLEECFNKWDWDMEQVLELGQFKEWQYEKIQTLSLSIERHMLAKYNAVKTSFERNSKDLTISEEDRNALERKVNTMFLERPFKIRRILLVARSEHLFNRLYLKHETRKATGKKFWVLFHRQNIRTGDGEEALIQALTIEEIGAWLINNGLYTSRSVLNMMPNSTLVTHDDIVKLYKAMLEFFSPIINQVVPFSALRKSPPRVTSLFINVNFYHARQGSRISDYCAVFVNSWGEMFYHLPKPGIRFSNLEAAKKDIMKGIGITAFPQKTSFYFSKGVPR